MVFPDGTVMFALHVDSRKPGDAAPDFGLYLDRAWSPEWNSIIIPWQDFDGAPPNKEYFFEALTNAFYRASSGEWIELGCEEGCGRTGTALSCMAVISGIPASDAVSWVRTNYDKCAVETKDQERLVADFARWFKSAELLR